MSPPAQRPFDEDEAQRLEKELERGYPPPPAPHAPEPMSPDAADDDGDDDGDS